MKPTFFRTSAELGRWLEKNHAAAAEFLVGFYKKGSGKPSLTWPEAVDEALCYGWIDGVRKRIDDVSYTIRFTPRKPRSTWSKVNVDRVQALSTQGRMRPAGLAAFEARQEARSGTYSYEQRSVELAEPYRGMFEKEKAAWKFFQAQTPSYRKAASWWVVSAKREDTRRTRLATLIAHSAAAKTLPQFTRSKPAAV